MKDRTTLNLIVYTTDKFEIVSQINLLEDTVHRELRVFAVRYKDLYDKSKNEFFYNIETAINYIKNIEGKN